MVGGGRGAGGAGLSREILIFSVVLRVGICMLYFGMAWRYMLLIVNDPTQGCIGCSQVMSTCAGQALQRRHSEVALVSQGVAACWSADQAPPGKTEA